MERSVSEQDVDCPFCGERITLLVDASAGSQEYIEDCSVCCRPMQVSIDADGGDRVGIRVDHAG